VNLLLVEPTELAGDGTCTLADRRADHLRRVLGVTPGSTVRAGIVGGQVGTAEVISDDGAALILRVTATAPPPPRLELELVLAIPRPKALSRVIETCAAFAVRRIELTNAWRVDKSYLRSPRLDPAALAHAARLGAEQGATTLLPELAVHERLMALLDTRFPAPGGLRLIAHPGAPPIETVATSRPETLAIGPEGGWIERELDTFVARGFTPCSLGTPILRVEPAVAALLGQLVVLDRIKHASPSS
jgi:RsmE family RNA methyltransferase